MNENEDRVIGYREDTGEPIYESDSDKALAKIRGEKSPSLLNYFRKKITGKEKETVNNSKVEPKKKEEPESLPVPAEKKEETAIEPAERPLYELARRKEMELELIREFELRPRIDYYEIGGKQIFTKEGLSKFMPFITIGGYKVNYKVAHMIDEPLYKRVRVRAWLGPEDTPIQVAEGTCDWREDLAWNETILDKVGKTLKKQRENKQLDPKRDLLPEDVEFDPETGQVQIKDEVKRYYVTIDHLRKRIFALRVTEGKAIKRGISHITGLSTTSKKEMKAIEAEARVLHEKG